MPDVHRFDADLDQAWVEFRESLADRLLSLTPGRSTSVTCYYDPYVEPINARPCVTFSVTGAHRLRCEIPPDAQRQPFQPLLPEHVVTVVELGWRPRRSGAYVLEVGPRFADKMAAHVVTVLRDVWQVPHPAFLDATSPSEPSPHLAVRPHARHHLQDLAAVEISRLLDATVDRDEDGDIALTVGDSSSWLIVQRDEPTLEFVTFLATKVRDRAQATATLELHRRLWPEVNMVVDGDRVVALLRLEATVFVARNLEAAFAKWIAFMQDGYAEIVEALADEPVEVDEPLPPPLQALLHLDPDGMGGLTPADVAEVCSYDRDAILDYLRITSEQEASWRRSAGDAVGRGDGDEADACVHEAEAWAHTHENLRAALRVVVLPDNGRHRQRRLPTKPESLPPR